MLKPYVLEALTQIVPVLIALVTAWLRVRTQRLIVEQATIEADAAGEREGLPGEAKKELATALSTERMGTLVRPSPERLDQMIEQTVQARRSASNPPDEPGGG